jgi:hypothetical protein
MVKLRIKDKALAGNPKVKRWLKSCERAINRNTNIDAPNMTPKSKRDIANWLRKQAKALIKDGNLYSPKCISRYLYEC